MNFYQHTYLPGAGSFSNDSRKMLQCRHQQQAVPLCLPPGTGLQGALRLLHEAADNSLIMRPKMCWSGIRKNLILRKYVLFFCLQGRRSKPQAMMKDLVCPAVHRSWYRPPWHTPPGTGPLAQAPWHRLSFVVMILNLLVTQEVGHVGCRARGLVVEQIFQCENSACFDMLPLDHPLEATPDRGSRTVLERNQGHSQAIVHPGKIPPLRADSVEIKTQCLTPLTKTRVHSPSA